MLKGLLLHWFFPQTCAHCAEDLPREASGPLCGPCEKGLSGAEPPYCHRCAAKIGPSRSHCRSCGQSLHACRVIRAACWYRGPAVSLVHGLKYRGRRDAAAYAAARMARVCAKPELRDFDALIPVPLHPARLAERGYNQALLLARKLSTATGRPVLELLERRRPTRPQWGLGRAARRENLADAISVREGLAAPERALLIDDVCTSSATLEACARALQSAGARRVSACVFARRNRGELT